MLHNKTGSPLGAPRGQCMARRPGRRLIRRACFVAPRPFVLARWFPQLGWEVQQHVAHQRPDWCRPAQERPARGIVNAANMDCPPTFWPLSPRVVGPHDDIVFDWHVWQARVGARGERRHISHVSAWERFVVLVRETHETREMRESRKTTHTQDIRETRDNIPTY